MSEPNNKVDRRRKRLLILECDSKKLNQQGLAIGNELAASVKALFSRNAISLVESRTIADLLESLGEITKDKPTFSAIVLIGHSAPGGVQLSSDRFVTWKELAEWLKPFNPKKIILLACQAGKWLPCSALFEGLPSLDEIFGSPVFARPNEKVLVLGKVANILGAKKEDKDLNFLLQIANYAFTGGIMLHRTRVEYERGGDEEGRLWTDHIEPFLHRIVTM